MAGNEVLIIGLTSGPVWGCPDLSWGKGQSLDTDFDGDEKTIEDGKGITVAKAYYNNRTSTSYTVKICGTVPTNLKRGTVLTVDGTEMVIEKYKLSKKSGDFLEYSLTLATFEGITLTSSQA